MRCKYLIRLDDACPTMNREKWNQMENILDSFSIKPMVGIIPQNADPKQMIEKEDAQFWEKAGDWAKKGWTIALHGFDHCYISKEKGINPMWGRSEFAGVSLDVQKNKIREGVAILSRHGLYPKYFFAPSHTFDLNTLVALKDCSEIRVISDTMAFSPYKDGDFVYIPQQFGHCMTMPFGVWTFCYHPNTMAISDFEKLKVFLNANNKYFISFNELDIDNIKGRSFFDKFFNWLYFSYRKLRKIG